ncbi:MAG: InlB B-repeat-containing protein, partial [Pseudomonas sp.]
MTASPATLNVFIGGVSVTSTITITRANYTGVVTLNASVLPTGVTAAFNPASLSGSTVSSTLTLTAAADATPNPGGIVVRATGPDSLQAFLEIPVQVSRPQVRITRAGTGTGTVTSSPAGVNCGSVCDFAFPFGTNVTLTATPAAGSAFGGWTGGACTGTSTTCSLAVTAAPLITATFNSTAQNFTLGISPTAAVPQGGNATVTATIKRSNGFAGTVTFTSSGAPSGVTIGANTAGATDTTATIS